MIFLIEETFVSFGRLRISSHVRNGEKSTKDTRPSSADLGTCKPGRENTESGAATFYCCRVVGPNLFTVFTVFYAHYAEDHLPKSNGRETIHLSDLSLSGFYDVIHT